MLTNAICYTPGAGYPGYELHPITDYQHEYDILDDTGPLSANILVIPMLTFSSRSASETLHNLPQAINDGDGHTGVVIEELNDSTSTSTLGEPDPGDGQLDENSSEKSEIPHPEESIGACSILQAESQSLSSIGEPSRILTIDAHDNENCQSTTASGPAMDNLEMAQKQEPIHPDQSQTGYTRDLPIDETENECITFAASNRQFQAVDPHLGRISSQSSSTSSSVDSDVILSEIIKISQDLENTSNDKDDLSPKNDEKDVTQVFGVQAVYADNLNAIDEGVILESRDVRTKNGLAAESELKTVKLTADNSEEPSLLQDDAESVTVTPSPPASSVVAPLTTSAVTTLKTEYDSPLIQTVNPLDQAMSVRASETRITDNGLRNTNPKQMSASIDTIHQTEHTKDKSLKDVTLPKSDNVGAIQTFDILSPQREPLNSDTKPKTAPVIKSHGKDGKKGGKKTIKSLALSIFDKLRKAKELTAEVGKENNNKTGWLLLCLLGFTQP